VLFAINNEAELLGNLSLSSCHTWKFVPNEYLVIYVVFTILPFCVFPHIIFVDLTCIYVIIQIVHCFVYMLTCKKKCIANGFDRL